MEIKDLKSEKKSTKKEKKIKIQSKN